MPHFKFNLRVLNIFAIFENENNKDIWIKICKTEDNGAVEKYEVRMPAPLLQMFFSSKTLPQWRQPCFFLVCLESSLKWDTIDCRREEEKKEERL